MFLFSKLLLYNLFLLVWNNPLPETSRDVVLRLHLIGIRKYLPGISKLHHPPHIEESRIITDTRCLLHVVGDDDDSVLLLQLVDKLFHLGGGDGVEGGCRLVHQQDRRRHRHGTGYAEALLLTAGEGVGGDFQLVLHLVPKGRRLSGFLPPADG